MIQRLLCLASFEASATEHPSPTGLGQEQSARILRRASWTRAGAGVVYRSRVLVAMLFSTTGGHIHLVISSLTLPRAANCRNGWPTMEAGSPSGHGDHPYGCCPAKTCVLQRESLHHVPETLHVEASRGRIPMNRQSFSRIRATPAEHSVRIAPPNGERTLAF